MIKMKLTIEENKSFLEPNVIIKCAFVNEEVNKIVSAVNACQKKFAGVYEGKKFYIPLEDIYFFESLEDKTFMYTASAVYECEHRLYEIEKLIYGFSFCRVSKQAIVNIKKIEHIKPQLNGRFEASLDNGLRQIVNRHYVADLRRMFESL